MTCSKTFFPVVLTVGYGISKIMEKMIKSLSHASESDHPFYSPLWLRKLVTLYYIDTSVVLENTPSSIYFLSLRLRNWVCKS